MNNKTINAVVSIPATQLKDDVLQAALAEGFTVREVEAFERQLKYRKQYNSRPEVVARRKQYAAKRYQRMKELRMLLQG